MNAGRNGNRYETVKCWIKFELALVISTFYQLCVASFSLHSLASILSVETQTTIVYD